MRLTAPIQLLLLALTATQSSASPLAAPPSNVTSREVTDLTADTPAVEKRSYQNSCTACSISNTSNPILRCLCNTTGGARVWTELALNNCIANRDGQMRWAAGGNFGRSCNSIDFEPREFNTVKATCDKPGSPAQYTKLSMTGRIHNRDGRLAC